MALFFGTNWQERRLYCILVLSMSVLAGGCTGSHQAASSDDIPATASTQPGDDAETGDDNDNDSGAPSVSLTADTPTIVEGGSVTLNWNASDADSCSATGGWNGQLGTSGSQTIGPISAGTTFSLNCSGPGGTALEMLSVAVVGPIALSWVAPDENVDGSQLVDLAGYRIYYGTESRAYSDSVELEDAGATNHSLTLASGDYFVAMTAFDTEGHESSYSNEVLRNRP